MGRKFNKFHDKINIFAIIYFDGPFVLMRIDDNFNSDYFIDCLEESLEKISNYTLCIDQVRYHTSNYTIDWLEDNEVDYIILPQKGSNINVIENIWKILKQEVFKQRDNISNIDELYETDEETFYNSEVIKNSIKNAYITHCKIEYKLLLKDKVIYIKIESNDCIFFILCFLLFYD